MNQGAGLAGLLSFLTVERCGSQSAVMGFGRVALEPNPLCLRVVDSMAAEAGVSALHGLTGGAPMVLARALHTRLPTVAGLPAAARAALPKDPEQWGDAATGGRDDCGEVTRRGQAFHPPSTLRFSPLTYDAAGLARNATAAATSSGRP